jgi:hypothetical protein
MVEAKDWQLLAVLTMLDGAQSQKVYLILAFSQQWVAA